MNLANVWPFQYFSLSFSDQAEIGINFGQSLKDQLIQGKIVEPHKYKMQMCVTSNQWLFVHCIQYVHTKYNVHTKYKLGKHNILLSFA